MDANKKRTGWEEAIFGQDEDYRVAQQRAVSNAVQGLYLEQATEIEKYAGESPEDYSSRLNEGLDKVLETCGDDKETRSLAAATWTRASEKLASKQYEEHYAFNQMQQRET